MVLGRPRITQELLALRIESHPRDIWRSWILFTETIWKAYLIMGLQSWRCIFLDFPGHLILHSTCFPETKWQRHFMSGLLGIFWSTAWTLWCATFPSHMKTKIMELWGCTRQRKPGAGFLNWTPGPWPLSAPQTAHATQPPVSLGAFCLPSSD